MNTFLFKGTKGTALILLLISLLFMLVVSCWTSFLNPYYLYDSSVWCVMGEGWKAGLLPYRDLFDHKGCYLYAFYALAACFGNIKLGLTVLMTILLTVDALFVYKIARLFLSKKATWGVVMLFYGLLAGMIGNCGCVEELSLPFLLWPLCRLLSLCCKQNLLEDIRKRDFAMIGLCGGIHAMLRVNNAGCLVGAAIFVFLYLLYHRRFATVCKGLALAGASFIAALLPGLLYFAWHGALYDLWYGTFLFNFIYAGSSAETHSWISNLLPHTHLWVLGAAMIADRNHTVLSRSAKALIVCIATVGTSAICIGQGFAHYAICVIPSYVVAASYALALFNRFSKRLHYAAAALALCAVLLIPHVRFLRGQIVAAVSTLMLHNRIPCPALEKSHTYQYVQAYAEANRAFLTQWASCIPEDERHSFLAYNCFGDVYLYMNILPEYKYCFIQDDMASHPGSEIAGEMRKHLTEAPPLWLLISHSTLTSPLFKETIEPHYRLIRQGGMYYLLRYKQ